MGKKEARKKAGKAVAKPAAAAAANKPHGEGLGGAVAMATRASLHF
jgi:hypothetical protein